MPKLRAWPLLFALGACDGATTGDSANGPNGDAGADAPLTTTLLGPAPSLSSSPGYEAPPKLQYRILAGHGDGSAVQGDAMLAAMRSADVVCLGETHDSFAVHSMQLLLVDRLRSKPNAVDPLLGLGFEMFQRPFQSALDDFAIGRITEGTFRANSQFDVRWRYPWELYQPLVLQGIAQGHPLVALLTEKELTSRIDAVGLAGLTPEERANVPELDLTSQPHRTWFRAQLGDAHGALTDDVFEGLYTIQVVWDETMAQTAWAWLAGAPGRHMAVIAGRGHCIDMAIPDRLRRRGVAKVVALQILDDDVGSTEAAALNDPADYVVGVSTLP